MSVGKRPVQIRDAGGQGFQLAERPVELSELVSYHLKIRIQPLVQCPIQLLIHDALDLIKPLLVGFLHPLHGLVDLPGHAVRHIEERFREKLRRRKQLFGLDLCR